MSLMTVNRNPSERELAQFAWIGTAVLALLAFWHFGPVLTPCLLAAALVLGLTGTVRPAGLRGLYVGLLTVTAPIGAAVSFVLLAVIYYGVFTPVAAVFRLLGRDALQRRLQPELASYWEPRRPVTGPRRYLRQY
jgi:hypothetical protein